MLCFQKWSDALGFVFGVVDLQTQTKKLLHGLPQDGIDMKVP